MPYPTMTREIARDCALDAGSRRMREAGRSAWDAGDYDAACDEFDRLMRIFFPEDATEEPPPNPSNMPPTET